jgi:serine/threonine protein phosphatase PrpC
MPEVATQIERVEPRERKREWVNVGEPPITGVKKKGNPERKDRCEDEKINDPDKGLFLICDGVSTANGWFTAREAAVKASEILGEELDRKLENIFTVDHISLEKKQTLMIQLIAAEIQRTILEANQNIKSKSKFDSRISGDVATTFSLARLVEMPDKIQRVFVANVGDSRVFVLRGDRLIRLTQDDNILSSALKQGLVSPTEAHLVDQASGADNLPEHLKFFFRQRHVVTRAVGALQDDQIEVKRYRVLHGDRLILASDGLTDQLTEKMIGQILREQVDDRAAERSLQTRADQMALDGTDPRAEGDDVSVIVHRIAKQRQDRTYAHAQEDSSKKSEITKAQVEAWRAQIPKTEALLQQMRTQSGNKEEVQRLETELARLEYWVAQKDLEEIQVNTPPRFGQNDFVRVRASQADSGQRWLVSDYKPEEDQYIIAHPSGHKYQTVERFTLELAQTGDLVESGDKIELSIRNGKRRRLYTVMGEDDGNVVLMSELPEGVERRLEPSSTVERAIREQFQRAFVAKKQKERARSMLLGVERSGNDQDDREERKA